ncbi:hypothetical protein ACTXT7_004153 [Hymenolepis weldensis]
MSRIDFPRFSPIMPCHSMSCYTMPCALLTNSSVLSFFWNRARSWLNLEEHWVDPQKAYDVFRTNVLSYMCDNDTWTCCSAGVMDVSCSSPPPPMQELVFILMDPTQNMPVLFLYWWCTQGGGYTPNSSKDAFFVVNSR